ncbi:MAG: hypothetical protein ACRBBR_07300 [Cellvibrionaceae bacterium]
MMILRFVSFLLVCVLISACSTQEATEDEYLDGADSHTPGPGIFSGDKGGFTFSDIFGSDDEKRKKGTGGSAYATSSDINLPAIDEESFEDFENFKAWRRAQQPGSASYQEYQDWRAYQQYRRLKIQQEQNKPAN